MNQKSDPLCRTPSTSSVGGGLLLRRGQRAGGADGQVPRAPERPAVALRAGGARRAGGLAAGGPAATALPGGAGRRTRPPAAQQPAVCG